MSDNKVSKNFGVLVIFFIIISVVLSGCSNHNSKPTTAKVPTKKETPKPSIHIESASLKQSSSEFKVQATMKNESNTSTQLNSSAFALMINDSSLKPNSKTSVPKTISANSTINVTLLFNNNQIKGEQDVKLSYESEGDSQTFDIGNVNFSSNEGSKAAASSNADPKKEASAASTSNGASSTKKTNSTNTFSTTNALNTMNFGRVSVKIPSDWKHSPYNGGDFSGFTFQNPNDPHQKLVLVESRCVGCGYPDANPSAKPNPKSLIPVKNTTSYIFKSGLGVGYQYYESGNPYLGSGLLKMEPGTGYAFVEILLPVAQKSMRNEILNSFSYDGN